MDLCFIKGIPVLIMRHIITMVIYLLSLVFLPIMQWIRLVFTPQQEHYYDSAAVSVNGIYNLLIIVNDALKSFRC